MKEHRNLKTKNPEINKHVVDKADAFCVLPYFWLRNNRRQEKVKSPGTRINTASFESKKKTPTPQLIRLQNQCLQCTLRGSKKQTG